MLSAISFVIVSVKKIIAVTMFRLALSRKICVKNDEVPDFVKIH